MPATESKRKNAMENVVTTLAGINGTGSYFRDLSLTGNVSMKQLSTSQRTSAGVSFAWVRAGNEDIVRQETSPGKLMQGQFEILVDIIVHDDTSETLVEELEDLIHDVSLALGSNRTLTGVVVDSMIESIEPPAYSFEQSWAGTTIHLACVYDFVYGSEI